VWSAQAGSGEAEGELENQAAVCRGGGLGTCWRC